MVLCLGQNTQVRFKLTLPRNRENGFLIIHHFRYFVKPSFNLKIQKIKRQSPLVTSDRDPGLGE